jgi:hypothetical protein
MTDDALRWSDVERLKRGLDWLRGETHDFPDGWTWDQLALLWRITVEEGDL